MLIAGVIILVPTILTGWFSWKRQYKGALVEIFIFKIRISYSMLVIGIFLIIFRGIFVSTKHTIWHYIYGIGFLLFQPPN